MSDNWRDFAATALKRNDWKAALQRLDECGRGARKQAEFLKLLCCAHLQAGQWKKVARNAAAAVKLHPGEAIFWECWSWAEHLLGRTTKAAEILEEAYPRFRSRESLVYALCCLYSALKRFEEAEEFLVQAMRLSSDPESFVKKASRQKELRALWAAQEVCFAA